MRLALNERLDSTQMHEGWCKPTATGQCCVDSNGSETILAQIGGLTAVKDWVEPDYQGKMEI